MGALEGLSSHPMQWFTHLLDRHFEENPQSHSTVCTYFVIRKSPSHLMSEGKRAGDAGYTFDVLAVELFHIKFLYSVVLYLGAMVRYYTETGGRKLLPSTHFLPLLCAHTCILSVLGRRTNVYPV